MVYKAKSDVVNEWVSLSHYYNYREAELLAIIFFFSLISLGTVEVAIFHN